MQFVPPSRWKRVLVSYAVVGSLLGATDPLLRAGLERWGVRPQLAPLIDVNVLMPLAMIALAVWYPRTWSACAGAIAATLGFAVGLALTRAPRFWAWSPALLASVVHPVLVGAVAGYMGVGSVSAWLVRPWRTVGRVDEGVRCERCGYLLIGLHEGRCPECGRGFDPVRVAVAARALHGAERDAGA